MRTCALLGLVFALLGDAAAQPVATDAPRPAPQPVATGAPRSAPHPHGGLGGTLTGGLVGRSETPAGWVARIEYELFPVLAPTGTTGAILGFHAGWEFWRAKPDWGLAMPVAIVLGVRAEPVRATAGVGVDMFLVDVVDDDTGFGLYAPFASARVGADVLGIQLGADARIVRRWQIGAPDHTQWQLGAFIGGTWEPEDRRARD